MAVRVSGDLSQRAYRWRFYPAAEQESFFFAGRTRYPRYKKKPHGGS